MAIEFKIGTSFYGAILYWFNKKYLSKKECDFIESMEDKRLNNKGFYMGLYGMVAIIKLNLYLYREDNALKWRYIS